MTVLKTTHYMEFICKKSVMRQYEVTHNVEFKLAGINTKIPRYIHKMADLSIVTENLMKFELLGDGNWLKIGSVEENISI